MNNYHILGLLSYSAVNGKCINVIVAFPGGYTGRQCTRIMHAILNAAAHATFIYLGSGIHIL